MEDGFWGAVLKGLVKKVESLLSSLRENVAIVGVKAVGVLVEKWDAEDLDAWGASGWLVENAKKRSEKLEKRWKIDGMLFEKIRRCGG